MPQPTMEFVPAAQMPHVQELLIPAELIVDVETAFADVELAVGGALEGIDKAFEEGSLEVPETLSDTKGETKASTGTDAYANHVSK
jgi:hypothetical protein